jgi:hypothetical protein
MMLRRLEYHPAAEPQTLAAVKSLERARQRQAAKLLLESRNALETMPATAAATSVQQQPKPVQQPAPQPKEETFAASAPLSSISAPPPITTVLHDLYQEETNANN